MQITFLGQSAFLLDDGKHKLLIDPFLEGNPKCPVTLQEALAWKPDAVLLTHAHGDHWGNTMDFAKAGATVIAIGEIAGYAAQQGAQNTVAFNIGGTYKADWGSVKLTPAFHSSAFPDGTYGGMPTGMVIEFGGKRLYHAGDTNLFSDMRLIGDLGLDLAFLPVGDHFTMGPEEAGRCLELLRPKDAVPMHYGTFPVLTGDPQVFVDAATKQGVKGHLLTPGEAFSY